MITLLCTLYSPCSTAGREGVEDFENRHTPNCAPPRQRTRLVAGRDFLHPSPSTLGWVFPGTECLEVIPSGGPVDLHSAWIDLLLSTFYDVDRDSLLGQ